jgi:hypothetical protein
VPHRAVPVLPADGAAETVRRGVRPVPQPSEAQLKQPGVEVRAAVGACAYAFPSEAGRSPIGDPPWQTRPLTTVGRGTRRLRRTVSKRSIVLTVSTRHGRGSGAEAGMSRTRTPRPGPHYSDGSTPKDGDHKEGPLHLHSA